MKLKTNSETYTVTSYTPRGADGCMLVCGEPPDVGGVLTIESDDGMLLNAYTVADYLRCVVDGCTVTLTNTPEQPPMPPPEPITPEPSAEDDLAALAIDHECRITMLEMGVTNNVM